MFNVKKFCSVMFCSVTFMISQQVNSAENEIKFSNEKIKICNGDACEYFKVPAEIVMDSNAKLERQSIDDEPGEEILFTQESDVNTCATVLYIDWNNKELKKYHGGRDICNFKKIIDGMIVSNYREGAIWKQDLIKIKSKKWSLFLAIHDPLHQN